MNDKIPPNLLRGFKQGLVIPAMPLALDAKRRFDPQGQKLLVRYYHVAGAGGLAVGVHTTQFEIREHGLFRPVLELASRELDRLALKSGRPMLKIAGLCGKTSQALSEAKIARELGYHACLLSLAALKGHSDVALAAHCRQVAKVLPQIGFYLQEAVGGMPLSLKFWRLFFKIPGVLGVKIAAFDRYKTQDVVRALAESGREGEVTLYTGNDDHIVLDLLTPWPAAKKTLWMKGGLLGHWAVDTRAAVKLLKDIQRLRASSRPIPPLWLKRAAQVTDANAAYFDPANRFKGCISGLHAVLQRQGLMANTLCLSAKEKLSPGQAAEIARVRRAYPGENDDAFIRNRLAAWRRDA